MTIAPPEVRRRSDPSPPFAGTPQRGYESSAPSPSAPSPRRAVRRESGLSGWAGLLVLLVIATIGGTIDELTGPGIRGGFNIALVIGSAVAILIVRRHAMFPIVIAPPIVYALASGITLYARLGGSANKRSIVIAAASNFLVYGFPAIAGATAATLIVAGIRMLIKR